MVWHPAIPHRSTRLQRFCADVHSCLVVVAARVRALRRLPLPRQPTTPAPCTHTTQNICSAATTLRLVAAIPLPFFLEDCCCLTGLRARHLYAFPLASLLNSREGDLSRYGRLQRAHTPQSHITSRMAGVMVLRCASRVNASLIPTCLSCANTLLRSLTPLPAISSQNHRCAR